jgi:ribosomal protein S18 acetylase RimI-like enzyme
MAELTNPSYSIRYAAQPDVPTILALIKELAIYEKALDSVAMTEHLLRSTLSFPTNPNPSPSKPETFTPGYAKALLITPSADPNEVAGFALFFNNYSTWQGPGIYLEDLYVREQYRGKGYGKALLAALAREVKALNPQGRLEWSVLKW